MFPKRNQSSQPSSPCGLAFDDRNGQIVIAEYAANGGLDIYRAILGERRAVDPTAQTCAPHSQENAPARLNRSASRMKTFSAPS